MLGNHHETDRAISWDSFVYSDTASLDASDRQNKTVVLRVGTGYRDLLVIQYLGVLGVNVQFAPEAIRIFAFGMPSGGTVGCFSKRLSGLNCSLLGSNI